MCYAIPGKIIEIKGDTAVVDYFGEHRNALNKFLNAKIGEYVYAQGGILVDRLPESEALEILTIWKERFFELKKKDRRLAKTTTITESNISSHYLLEIMQKVNLNKEITKNEILALLRTNNEDELNLIYTTANNIRQKEHDNACCVHGIIEFSNYCKNNCLYCGIRAGDNAENNLAVDVNKVERYRMPEEEIINTAKYAVKELGFKALVFQSGEDEWFSEEKLISLIKDLSKLNILIFISIGLRTKEAYKKLYDAGAKAVLLRFETSNKKLFEKLRPGTSFDERIQLIKELKKMGYIVATGFLIGLPDETDDDVINNILLTKELKADMYSFGPFIPTENTPLHGHKVVDKNIVLKTIAISRFVDRDSNILVTTALETLDYINNNLSKTALTLNYINGNLGKSAREQGLLAGANSLMINLTQNDFKKKYAIYKRNYNNGDDNTQKNDMQKSIKKEIKETINMLYSLGRAPMDINYEN